MRIIFLGIEGVMNSAASIELARSLRARGEFRVFDSQIKDLYSLRHLFAPWSVEALNRITDATGAGIVISSVWRETAIPWLRRWGVRGLIIDTTPMLDRNGSSTPSTRGDEIASWLERWPTRPGSVPVTSFVILNDEADAGALFPRLVQTRADERGLTDEHATLAINVLHQPCDELSTAETKRKS